MAAACNEMDAERGEGEDDSPRSAASPLSPVTLMLVLVLMLPLVLVGIFMLVVAVVRRGIGTGEEECGREFRSGGAMIGLGRGPM